MDRVASIPQLTPARPPGLATLTDLRAMRLRLSPGQQPAATRSYGYGRTTDLYEIRRAEALPPLGERRQAAYDTARTCTHCGQLKAGRPLEEFVPTYLVHQQWREGTPLPAPKRMCAPCIEALSRECWAERWAADRAASTSWAQGVLADPDALIIVDHPIWTGEVGVVGTDGRTLLLEDVPRRALGYTPAHALERIRQRVMDLGHRRWIGRYQSAGLVMGSRPGLTVAGTDSVEDRWTLWMGQRGEDWPWRTAAGGRWTQWGWRGQSEYIHQNLCCKEAIQTARKLVDVLQTMAADRTEAAA